MSTLIIVLYRKSSFYFCQIKKELYLSRFLQCIFLGHFFSTFTAGFAKLGDNYGTVINNLNRSEFTLLYTNAATDARNLTRLVCGGTLIAVAAFNTVYRPFGFNCQSYNTCGASLNAFPQPMQLSCFISATRLSIIKKCRFPRIPSHNLRDRDSRSCTTLHRRKACSLPHMF